MQQDSRVEPSNPSIEITACTRDLDEVWDEYARKHQNSTHCHLAAWRNIFRETYGHKGHYLLARAGTRVLGVLPLFYIRSLTGKGSLISMPFLDTGGVLADSPEIEGQLLEKAITLAKSLAVENMELRYTDLPKWAFTMNDQ